MFTQVSPITITAECEADLLILRSQVPLAPTTYLLNCWTAPNQFPAQYCKLFLITPLPPALLPRTRQLAMLYLCIIEAASSHTYTPTYAPTQFLTSIIPVFPINMAFGKACLVKQLSECTGHIHLNLDSCFQTSLRHLTVFHIVDWWANFLASTLTNWYYHGLNVFFLIARNTQSSMTIVRKVGKWFLAFLKNRSLVLFCF